jgi:hypothetical protein
MAANDKRSGLKNLILVNNPRKQDWKELAEVARRVVNSAFDIKIFIVSVEDTADIVPAEAWKRPTLTVAFGDPGRFVPRRGRLFHNEETSKPKQQRALAAAGIPVPPTAFYEPGMVCDPAVYGEFVVLKDLALRSSSQGKGVRWFRTGMLNRLDASGLAAYGLDPAVPRQVQRFVDVGERPYKIRVLTLFGEPLYVAKLMLNDPRPALDSDDETIARANVDTGAPGERTYTFETDEEAMALGRRVAAEAFPDLPLLGIDVIREAATGKLYVLEVNAGGNTWHFSSSYWRPLHKEFPWARAKMVGMLDAFGTAAKVLVERTRRYAA